MTPSQRDRLAALRARRDAGDRAAPQRRSHVAGTDGELRAELRRWRAELGAA